MSTNTSIVFSRIAAYSRLIFSEIKSEVPKPLGETPVPPGRVRRFHYTEPQNIPSIKQHGIQVSHSHGKLVHDPVAVWSEPESSLKEYKEISRSKPVVEFHADPKSHEYHPYASFDNVKPEHIVAIHEPWHDHYRYARKNNISPDEMRGLGPDYDKAADTIEKENASESPTYRKPLRRIHKSTAGKSGFPKYAPRQPNFRQHFNTPISRQSSNHPAPPKYDPLDVEHRLKSSTALTPPRVTPKGLDNWRQMPRHEQQEYLKLHPRSHYRKLPLNKERAPDQPDEEGKQQPTNTNTNDSEEHHPLSNPLYDHMRPMTPHELQTVKESLNELSSAGALDHGSRQRSEAAAAIEHDGARLLARMIPGEVQHDILAGFDELKQQQPAKRSETTPTKFLEPSKEVRPPRQKGSVPEVKKREPSKGPWGLRHRDEEIEDEPVEEIEDDENPEYEEDEGEDRRNINFKPEQKPKLSRDQQLHKRKYKALKNEHKRLKKQHKLLAKKLRRRRHRLVYIVGALVVSALLGVGLSAVNPILALYFGAFAIRRIHSITQQHFQESGLYIEHLAEYIIASSDNKMEELVKVVANYLREGDLPTDLLDRLKIQLTHKA